jgi:hypothetical protein
MAKSTFKTVRQNLTSPKRKRGKGVPLLARRAGRSERGGEPARTLAAEALALEHQVYATALRPQ